MDIKDLKITEKEISFTKTIEFVTYVVSKSFGENDGKYHAYLRDYYEMVSLLTLYTNYDGEYNIDEIMAIKSSKEWNRIEVELGDKYYQFVNYVDSELNHLNAPFAKFDDVLNQIGQLLVNVNGLVEYMSKDENTKKLIESFDTDTITDLLNTYANLIEKKEDNKTEEVVADQHS